MKSVKKEIWIVLLVLLSGAACKQPYNPPALSGNYHYLVVDGFINSGSDSTVFVLSRTLNLGSGDSLLPELNASVSIVGSGSETYQLAELGNGRYFAYGLNLNTSETYKLKITTSNNSQYESDPTPVVLTPPIDSLHWQTDSAGLSTYVTTHDPLNQTHYYQWTYVETWESRSRYSSDNMYQGGIVVPRPQSRQIYRCWSTAPSTDLVLASSVSLSQDLISNYRVCTAVYGTNKVVYLYSLLVYQNSLTKPAFDYWQSLKSNTQNLGSIFDQQPGQISGNIHNVNNPNEPVLGYVSAGDVQQQRIFVSGSQISWPYTGPECQLGAVGPNNLSDFADTLYLIPISGLLDGAYSSTMYECGDCRAQGGVTTMPSFWPN